MLQLRTGYSKLSGNRHKLGQVETRFCQCWNRTHNLLECPLYDEARCTLMKRLSKQLGIHAPNIYTLQGYDSLLEFPNWRGLICEEVGGYIERTERFKETNYQKLASFFLSLYTATPPREDYVQVDCVLKPRYKKCSEKELNKRWKC